MIPARDVQRTVFDNGVRVVSERVKGLPAAVISLWIDAGSRYENLNESGASHLIQRMALHGAGDRSADAIAKEIDRLGGEFEADTQRDTVLYQMRVKAGDVEAAAELIADLSLRPQLSQAALTVESHKLQEDLREDEKDADSVLERMFLRSLWKGHGLCRSPRGQLLVVKGKAKVEMFKPQKLQSFHKQSHHPKAMTLTVVGDIRHEPVAKLAFGLFGSMEQPKKTVSTITPNAYQFLALRNRPQLSKVRFEIGFPACAASDKQRPAAQLLNAAIAGSSGSRLALLASEGDLSALSVSSQLRTFEDIGCLYIRARAERQNVQSVIERVVEELWRIADAPLDSDELDRARATRQAALLDQLDSLPKRSAALALAERYFKRLVPLEEEFEALERVTVKEIHQLASLWINPYQLSLAVLGNLTGLTISRRLLQRR